jgi:phosphate transport system permease protein
LFDPAAFLPVIIAGMQMMKYKRHTEMTLKSATDTDGEVPQAKKLNGDAIFRYLTTLFAFSILVILAVMLAEMTKESLPSMRKFGWKFVTASDWDAVQGIFGALPYLYGSIVSSVLALLLATPLSIGAALFITEICPKRLGSIIMPVVELLAAIPSVIYGLWGVLVMAPWLQSTVEPFLIEHFGFIPLFQGAPYGVSMLAAVFILMIMVIPIITSITKEVLLAVPLNQKEAAIALGATRWEAIMLAVLPYGRSGIVGAAILGLGRAVGETMAVTMVIGNAPKISLSLLSPAYTMPSVIANEFAETTSKLHGSALMEIGLILLVVTLVINALARLLIWGVSKNAGGAA